MDFELSEEHKMLREMARDFARREMAPTLKDYERQRKINYDIIKKMDRKSWDLLIFLADKEEKANDVLGPLFPYQRGSGTGLPEEGQPSGQKRVCH